MSRDFQNNRIPFDPYELDYDSGYSGQTNEYKELYNPYKSVWAKAVKGRTPHSQDRSKQTFYSSGSTHRFEPNEGRGYKVNTGEAGQQGLKQPATNNLAANQRQANEEIFDSGYNVTRRNTYGYRTTGYGPRD
ncbi:hypothetical protein [uncultured Pontibacter sp.]|uniref:hypothetical protein n=1 Tax=uncultured Pontibacter sp. TaxID=453356 RepID=UPI002606DB6D|nr:hypothetical protein [uncultured Pontibacter sp.]